MTDYYQVLGHAREMVAELSQDGIPSLREQSASPPAHAGWHSSSNQHTHAAAAAGNASSSAPITPLRPSARTGAGDAVTPPPNSAVEGGQHTDTKQSTEPCRVVLGSKLQSPRDLIPLEAKLLRKLKWRLNDPCAFDWAASLVLTAHPTPPGSEPGPVARDLLLRASTVLDLAVLHPWCAQQCELSLGAAAVAAAGMGADQLRPALEAARAPALLQSPEYAPAQRLVQACAQVCPPLEGHCLVEAAVHEFHPSEFLWLQSHCEQSRGLVAALQ